MCILTRQLYNQQHVRPWNAISQTASRWRRLTKNDAAPAFRQDLYWFSHTGPWPPPAGGPSREAVS